MTLQYISFVQYGMFSRGLCCKFPCTEKNLDEPYNTRILFFLGFDIMWSGRYSPFWRNLLPPSSGLKSKPGNQQEAVSKAEHSACCLPFVGCLLSLLFGSYLTDVSNPNPNPNLPTASTSI
jgi:hypothetical protein